VARRFWTGISADGEHLVDVPGPLSSRGAAVAGPAWHRRAHWSAVPLAIARLIPRGSRIARSLHVPECPCCLRCQDGCAAKGADGAEIARPARPASCARPTRRDRGTGPVTGFTCRTGPRRPESIDGRRAMVKGRLAAAPGAPASWPSEFAASRRLGLWRDRCSQARLLERDARIRTGIRRSHSQMGHGQLGTRAGSFCGS
jgi:hypothetical protein